MTQSPDTAKIPSDSWPDIQRVESFAGEIRVNLIRFAAIIIFYARHLFELWLRRHEIGMMNRYNLEVTGVVIAWLALAVVLHWDLADRKTGWWTKYIAIIWDLAMVTLLGMLATPRSSLLTLYFVIIATAPLRISLPLVWLATIGSWIGYALVLTHYVWWVIGRDVYYSTPDVRIPRKDEAIFILSLGAAGLCAGQAVRQICQRLFVGHAVAIGQVKES